MRVCIEKSTGKLIESQSGGDDIPKLMEARLDTLKQNAIRAGYAEVDIEVKFVTDAEFEAIMAKTTAPTPEQALKIKREKKIQERIRKIAIRELQMENDPDFPLGYEIK